MDRTHFLASQAFAEDTRNRPATKAETDAFYDHHGHDIFARAFRFRRWLDALAARLAKHGDATPDLAPMTPNR